MAISIEKLNELNDARLDAKDASGAFHRYTAPVEYPTMTIERLLEATSEETKKRPRYYRPPLPGIDQIRHARELAEAQAAAESTNTPGVPINALDVLEAAKAYAEFQRENEMLEPRTYEEDAEGNVVVPESFDGLNETADIYQPSYKK